ncbi:MAG: polysaccharide deacetylase family protein [Fibrobacter sp.]|nr:polysaccharide deacetylase family protein [Fibrobacter sp.]
MTAILFGHNKPKNIPGILFHTILPHPGMNLSEYSQTKFRNFLLALNAQNFKTVRVNEATGESGFSAKTPKCLLTFDDGLESFYKYALPVLQETNNVATIFCVAGYLGNVSDWDVYPQNRHLNEKQIREISDLGHEIGSHTLTHANLPFLNDKDLEIELRKSKDILENIIGKPVTSLSFPHGSWNKRVWEKAQDAGYTAATLYRNHGSAKSNQFPVFGAFHFDSTQTLLKRVSPSNTSFSGSIAAAKLLSHFSKGTPVWKFRKCYKIL